MCAGCRQVGNTVECEEHTYPEFTPSTRQNGYAKGKNKCRFCGKHTRTKTNKSLSRTNRKHGRPQTGLDAAGTMGSERNWKHCHAVPHLLINNIRVIAALMPLTLRPHRQGQKTGNEQKKKRKTEKWKRVTTIRPYIQTSIEKLQLLIQ